GGQRRFVRRTWLRAGCRPADRKALSAIRLPSPHARGDPVREAHSGGAGGAIRSGGITWGAHRSGCSGALPSGYIRHRPGSRNRFFRPSLRRFCPAILGPLFLLDLPDHLSGLDHRIDQQPQAGEGADAAQALAEQRQERGGGDHPRRLAGVLVAARGAAQAAQQAAHMAQRVTQGLGVVEDLLAVHLHAQANQLLVLIRGGRSTQGFVHGSRRSRLRAISSRVSWKGRAWWRTWLFTLPRQTATPMA